jgi:hypothetical protein
MIKHNQVGAVSGLGISLVLSIVLLLSAVIFGAWAFMSRQDYKSNVDAKINVAVGVARTQTTVADNASFVDKFKQPFLTFNGPEQYGSITFQYPKTWSAYVNGIGVSSANLIDGYFSQGMLQSVTDGTTDFALRIKVLNQAYDQTVQAYQGQSPTYTAAPYTLPKIPNVVGLEVSGQLGVGANGDTSTMVILPERTNTIEVWTDGDQNLNDFNDTVLKTFSFSP